MPTLATGAPVSPGALATAVSDRVKYHCVLQKTMEGGVMT